MIREIPPRAPGRYASLWMGLLLAFFAIGPLLYVVPAVWGPFDNSTAYGWVLNEIGGRSGIGLVGVLMMFLPFGYLLFLVVLIAGTATYRSRASNTPVIVRSPSLG